MADYCSNIKDEVEVTPYRKIQNGSITGAMIKDRAITKNKLAEGVIPPINNLHIYSTEEKVVGKWIDGKLVYEKTIFADSGFVSGENNIAHNISNFEKTIKTSGTLYKTGQYSRPIGEEINNGDYSAGIDLVNSTNIVLIIGSGIISDQLFDSLAITLQYTKTTDVPNA